MRFAVLAVLLSATSLLRAQIDNANITGRVWRTADSGSRQRAAA
jgi:hypothetical protein